MTFTVAFLILFLGMAIGYRLPAMAARLRQLYARLTYKPAVLRRVRLDDDGRPRQRAD
ncbi:MAG TPA: hypothetical protein VIT92_16790 [Burkholderiaceae bacterium]